MPKLPPLLKKEEDDVLAHPVSRRVVILTVFALLLASLLLPVVSSPARAATVTAGRCTLPVSDFWKTKLSYANSHPRVVFTRSDRDLLAERAADPATQKYVNDYLWWGRSIIDKNPALPGYQVGKVGSEGSAALGRIIALGFRYLGTDNSSDIYYSRVEQRLKDEVNALVAFPTWNPGHFIELSTVATATSIGYSLIADRLTPTERARITAAIATKSLTEASCLWLANDRHVNATDNWGAITNSSMTLAALAIADDYPDLAAAALGQALPRLNKALGVLGDGGTPEGPSYAAFLGTFAAYATASMANSIEGGDSYVTKVANAARFTAAIYGPSKQPFNFADSDLTDGRELLPVWNAYKGGDALGSWLGAQRLRENRANPLYVLWYSGPGVSPATRLGKTAYFPRTGVVSLRNGYAAGDSWIAVKGNANSGGHSHRELGGFVLDMKGVRFASDYGKDNYSLFEYFIPRTRETYFRTGTAGTSTVSNPGQPQAYDATAPITAPVTRTDGAVVTTLDLHRALRADKALRTVGVSKYGTVAITDDIRTKTARSLRWAMHTQASVRLAADRRSATLSRGGHTVKVTLSGARGSLRAVAAPVVRDSRGTYGYSNSGFTQLILDTKTVVPTGWTVAKTTIKMVFTPVS